VRELNFEPEGDITGLLSIEGEKIPFMDSVNPAATGAPACSMHSNLQALCPVLCAVVCVLRV